MWEWIGTKVIDQEYNAGYAHQYTVEAGWSTCPSIFTGVSFDASLPIDNCE